METAVFWGCCILTGQYSYEMSVREVLPKLGVELVDLPEENCCGDPVKSVNDFAATYLSVRILALANQTGLGNLLVPCNRCHFAVSEAKKLMENDEPIREKITGLLKEEGMGYNPDIKIWHVIDLLHDVVGPKNLKKATTKQLKGLRFASHVGCQLIRYSDLGRADDAEMPGKLDELITAVGAESVDYAEKLDCCGAALTRSHPDSALSLSGTKLKSLQALSIDGLVVSCPECGIMFDTKQKDASSTVGAKLALPVVYYTQLLGLAVGISTKRLGLHLNQSPVAELLKKIQI